MRGKRVELLDRFEHWEVWETAARTTAGAHLRAAERLALQRVRDAADAARARSERAGDLAGAVRAQLDAGLARLHLDDLDGAAAQLAAAGCRATGWERGYAAFAAGALAVARGDLAAGIGHFERAVPILRAHGDERAQAYALHRLGLVLAAAGDQAGARSRLLAALELFRRAGDRFGMLAVLGAPAPAPATLDALTPRERQIAALVAAGLTNRQIASRAFIAERTVDTHVQRILGKLNCQSRVQVAVLVDRGGQR